MSITAGDAIKVTTTDDQREAMALTLSQMRPGEINVIEFEDPYYTTMTPVRMINNIIDYYNLEFCVGDLFATIPLNKLSIKRELVYRYLLEEWNEKFNAYCQENLILP